MIVKFPEVFNISATPAVCSDLRAALSAEVPSIVLDLSDVREMDGAALDLLLRCSTKVLQRGGALRIASLSPHAATFLELTGMNRLFEAMPSSVDAVATAATFETPAETPALAEEPALQTSVA